MNLIFKRNGFTSVFLMALSFAGISMFMGCETKESSPEKAAPTVSTIPTFIEDQFSITVKGNLSSDGFDATTKRGFCYSIISRDPQPGGSDVVQIDAGTGMGIYSLTLDGLQSHTTYYLRAVATNAKGVGLGEVLTLRTTAGPLAKFGDFNAVPDPANDKQCSFTANVSEDGGTPVTERGVCWDTKVNPIGFNVTGLTSKFKAFGSGTGDFSGDITGLNGNTSYYIRSYAKNLSGYSYGPEVRITTVGLGISDIDAANTDRFGINLKATASSYGSLTLVEQGFVWGVANNPTLANGTKIVCTNSNNKMTATIDIAAPLEINKTYYIRSFVTNTLGTSYSEATRKIIFLPIGGSHKGGIIFWVSNDAAPKFLVVAESDIADSTSWGCIGDSINTADAINSGKANTDRILSCSEPDIAAKMCRSLSLGGSTSWDLPTPADFKEMARVLQPLGLGNFSTSEYWTSVQLRDSRASTFTFGSTPDNYISSSKKKNMPLRVRAVKTF